MNCPMTVTHHLRTHLVSLPRAINVVPAHGVDQESDRIEIEVDLVSENEGIGHQVAIVVSVIRVVFYHVPIICT